MRYLLNIGKLILMFFILFFSGLNFIYAASVDVGDDVNLNISVSEDLHLSATIEGFDTCDIKDYLWTEDTDTLNIETAYDKDNALIYKNNINSNPGTYKIKLTVTCNGGNSDDGGFIEEDYFVLTINRGESNIVHHHKSYSSKMRDEANNIFKKSEKIKLKLYEFDIKNKYFYKIGWNYIGGDNQINYELEYSSTKDFREYKKVKTKSRFYNFYKLDLEKSEIYFFRVKAIYKNKESSYSNLIYIVNKDNVLKDFEIKCFNCNKQINYGDIFETVDLLIEKKLYIHCNGCQQKELRYLFSDIFIYNKQFEFNVSKNKYCRKRINYNDIFNYKKGLGFKVECIKNNKINFDDIFDKESKNYFKIKCLNKNNKLNYNDVLK